jgi:hypothetical protein
MFIHVHKRMLGWKSMDWITVQVSQVMSHMDAEDDGL